jgi:hypothetical protein
MQKRQDENHFLIVSLKQFIVCGGRVFFPFLPLVFFNISKKGSPVET